MGSDQKLSQKPGMYSGIWLCYYDKTESTSQKSQRLTSKNLKIENCVEFYSDQEATDEKSLLEDILETYPRALEGLVL